MIENHKLGRGLWVVDALERLDLDQIEKSLG
jgi:hypothetical protein